MKKDTIDFLAILGVDTRYVSLYHNYIFINNLKFSRFSRKRVEIFLAKFPHWNVIRSKIFQKMCIRASRSLSQSLNPGEKILVLKDDTCADLILYLILEPYTRKYGIEIIYEKDLGFTNEYRANSIALSITLDQEVGKLINQLFNGEKIKLSSMETEKEGTKIIYPLINIPDSWIESWVQNNNLTCATISKDDISKDLLEFLEQYVPDARENMLKTAIYLRETGKFFE